MLNTEDRFLLVIALALAIDISTRKIIEILSAKSEYCNQLFNKNDDPAWRALGFIITLRLMMLSFDISAYVAQIV